jgi:ABC-type transporter Mla subunit MlaD
MTHSTLSGDGMHPGDSTPRLHASLRTDPLHCAIKHLEAAVCSARSAQPAHLATRLQRVRRVLDEHHRLTSGPDGLLDDVLQHSPHLTYRAQQLRANHGQLEHQLESLRTALTELDDARWSLLDALKLLSDLRHHQAQRTDFAFDAYLTDGGAGD